MYIKGTKQWGQKIVEWPKRNCQKWDGFFVEWSGNRLVRRNQRLLEMVLRIELHRAIIIPRFLISIIFCWKDERYYSETKKINRTTK